MCYVYTKVMMSSQEINEEEQIENIEMKSWKNAEISSKKPIVEFFCNT